MKGNSPLRWRSHSVLLALYLGFAAILMRLFYWQVIKAEDLQAQAQAQYQQEVTQVGQRGRIYFSNLEPLVDNQIVYRLFAHPHLIDTDRDNLADRLTTIVLENWDNYQQASPSARSQLEIQLNQQIKEQLHKEVKWVSLAGDLGEQTKEKIEQLGLSYLGFDQYRKRYYPEASMAAHLTGFVGKDAAGKDIGYFGLEGALEQELKPRQAKQTILTDALGLELFAEDSEAMLDGRDVVTTLRRDVQRLIEDELDWGMKHYSAEAGEIIVMDPKTGNLLGLASAPHYSQTEFNETDSKYYKNPSLSDLYEPGSTFKVLTVSAGIDAGVIEPDTVCDNCAGPRVFGKYTIRTWNDQYFPNTTITEGLVHSDNTAMIFVAERLGADKLRQYLKNFGLGEKVHIDLQEDQTTQFPEKWGPVELATISFGQGISLNSMQLIKAIASVANGGVMMKPNIVKQVKDPISQEVITVRPQIENRPISAQTASKVAQMMVEAASHGEAQWIASKTHIVAGKTGTSQIATEGGYDENSTIASFIGFAPAQDPKFIMFVKLTKPQSSPWAAETAAPLWYRIADQLYLLLDIPPDKITVPNS